MSKVDRKVIRVYRAAMQLYRHWVRLGASQWTPNKWCEPGHWYPLCSEKQAKVLGKACAAAKKGKRK